MALLTLTNIRYKLFLLCHEEDECGKYDSDDDNNKNDEEVVVVVVVVVVSLLLLVHEEILTISTSWGRSRGNCLELLRRKEGVGKTGSK